MNEPTPMPAAWCAARRVEIQAYVDGDGRRNAQETRTYLIELLAQLKQADYEISDLHIELKDKLFIEFQIAELIAENRKLRNTIAARDQYTDRLTEQYAAREQEFKRALQGLRAFARQTKCLRESNIEITAIHLNIPLD